MVQDSAIVGTARQDRFIKTSELAVANEVSQSTIRRRLYEAGLKHRVPAKKPGLTPRHKQLRLQFALQYLNHNFNQVAFLDEKVFTSSAHGRVSLWRVNNTRYDEANVRPNNRSGRISVGFWGWVSAAGPGEIVEIGGRLNGRGYKEILEESFFPTARNVYDDEEPITFIHDGCSIHNSRVVNEYIAGNDDLILIRLPPKSPDLNIIENVWGKMVQLWDHTQARTSETLRAHVTQIWESLRGDHFCYNAVRSMRQRLLDVINAEGGYTRY